MLPINRIKLVIDGATKPINDVMRLQFRANNADYKLYLDSYCLCFSLMLLLVACGGLFNKLNPRIKSD